MNKRSDKSDQELPQRGPNLKAKDKIGLFDPRVEHDACGVGFVARLDAQPSHALVEEALLALERMAHRGGSGSGHTDPDGAGVMFPIPRYFMRLAWRPICGELPEEYAIGHLFLPRDATLRSRTEEIVERVVGLHGLALLGWRDTPVRLETVSGAALESMPEIRQILVARTGAGHYGQNPSRRVEDAEVFERQIYVTRRHIEQAVFSETPCRPDDFHIASFSSRSIIYKGMLHGGKLAAFYQDLAHREFTAYFAVFHERYSTNTQPSWRLAQPFRCLAHNGEINTLHSNQVAMKIREPLLESPLFGEDMRYLKPVLDATASDSAMLDNAFEFLLRGGRSLAHTAMMLLPEPFGQGFIMGADKRAFYEYHAAVMEPWDGPAALVFSDGHQQVGAMLDRNALRPCRYVVTKDGLVLLASESGVLDIPAERISKRGRLHPRRMLLVDFVRHRVVTDTECKSGVIYARPYRHWLREQGVTLRDLPLPARACQLESGPAKADHADLLRQQQLYGFSLEEVKEVLVPMAKNAQEPVASMGMDTPLAVLSRRPQLLFSYLKQRFAQVTNPPIDPLREGLVMTLTGFLGRRGNLLSEGPELYRQLRMPNPVLFPEDLPRLLAAEHPAVKTRLVPALFSVAGVGNPGALDLTAAGAALEQGLAEMCAAAEAAVREGASVILLSDAEACAERAPIPSLLAVSALHQHLLSRELRHACGIAIDTGEARDVMQVAQLIAFGAGAVHPRVAFASIDELAAAGKLGAEKPSAPGTGTGGAGDAVRRARASYVTALQKGLLKTFSRMGISTLRSFNGGQGFEAVGLGRELVDRYFKGLPSRIGGVGLEHLAADVLARHAAAFGRPSAGRENPVEELKDNGSYRSRPGGETHLWSPAAIRALHRAVRENDYQSYRLYARTSDERPEGPVTLRSLLEFKKCSPLPLTEVEPAENILRRFVGAAMSFGSISRAAHEAVAIAFNRVGGRSNCGEGGELAEREKVLPNGDCARSRIRQIASGRFGVTAAYLAAADEIQIKMAQGAKPGEGGQLPANKVLPEIARVRHTIPGVTLISPPPHHDIYSIEDLAQLIYDLKRLHPTAKASVKLVAGTNVGTIASGVAKAGADNILISGHDGGTGASPRTAISYVGLPWELGLAETHAGLLHNGMRSRVILQTDGQLRTGRDLAVAAMLGAEEFAFGAGLLVSLGCCMLRVCHLGTCSVGVATQDPKLCAKLKGTADHVERYLRFLAEDLRENLAALGVRSLDELIGRADLLRLAPPPQWDGSGLAAPFENSAEIWQSKLARLALEPLLQAFPYNPAREKTPTARPDPFRDNQLEADLLATVLPALENSRPVRFEGRIKNTNRSVCTRLSGEIARRFGEEGLSPGSIEITLKGTAGQSAGAFLARGIGLKIVGEANDYVGKGLSGGVIVVSPQFQAGGLYEEQAAIGNVALYGATSGELYAAGSAGERFAVRNSGALAVVEGVGDHACEYMTGGVVVVLGQTGYNFAAGMSGGAAYVYDRSELFQTRCNMDGVDLESVWRPEDVKLLRSMLERHLRLTGSALAKSILDDWQAQMPLFLKVTPIEYRQALQRLQQSEDPQGESVAATEEVFN